MNAKKIYVVAFACLGLCVAALLLWKFVGWPWHDNAGDLVNAANDLSLNGGGPNGGQTLVVRVRKYSDEPSVVGSPEWAAWFQKLPTAEQAGYFLELEKSQFPGVPNGSDWAVVKVAPGPGSGAKDYFPCKVLTRYKPLLQVREGIGVLALQFSIHRQGDSILTSIWAANAKGAATVDWLNEKVFPANIKNTIPGVAAVPQYVPSGMNLFGDTDGELGISVDMKGAHFPWRKGCRAYPLVLDRAEPIAFGSVYIDKPRQLDSILCINISPPQLLGDIKMPYSATGLWCLYSRQNRVLLVIEHEWNWIAMIDFSKPNSARYEPAKSAETGASKVP